MAKIRGKAGWSACLGASATAARRRRPGHWRRKTICSSFSLATSRHPHPGSLLDLVLLPSSATLSSHLPPLGRAWSALIAAARRAPPPRPCRPPSRRRSSMSPRRASLSSASAVSRSNLCSLASSSVADLVRRRCWGEPVCAIGACALSAVAGALAGRLASAEPTSLVSRLLRQPSSRRSSPPTTRAATES
jgi:hypothetical protein